ncbi:hypothetical protein [Actinomadura chokoriensis]|uniref:hypothetical protein n=1 Tax=Actinomadura chokoriensis TaxID=454156 RepID=UPI0031F834CD
MAITDEQVDVLRAQLAGKIDEHRRLARQLTADEANTEYATLVAAAFIEAVERRFMKDGKAADDADVIDFVAQVRGLDDEMPDIIDPRLAESLIFHLLEKGTAINADPDTKFGHQIVLLANLVGEEQFSSAELDAFLSSARSLANELLE